ncbi:gamma-glutamylcyclotransferase [Leptolyngbya sp. AN03gr2]|uniref:gamma-glutamylcyclotransferase n=1 Tax=unclassified Leptolyngbya TaxID=2650499 RepID=UPI003D30F4F9
MTLTRAALVTGALKQMIQAFPELKSFLLTEDELQASIDQILQQKPPQSDVWIFAYGSLIWNPIIEYRDRIPGKIHGWHRSFCLRTPVGRGTPENPGLVLALESGGSCRGIAYRIAPEQLATELLLLWRREMVAGAYIPRWVKVWTAGTFIDAITFTINPTHPMYDPHLSVEQVATTIATAGGALGSCSDYLSQTIQGLAEHQIVDRSLLNLKKRAIEIDFDPQR